jgi:hypothetical protein
MDNKEKMNISVWCSWCDKLIGWVKWPKTINAKPTHGLCKTCFDKIMKDMEADK